MEIGFPDRTFSMGCVPRQRAIKRVCCLLGLFLGCLGTLPTAPAATSDMPFNRYSVEEGLSNRFVTAILQDRQGIMWIGTINGLNRFDGISFTTFLHDEQSSTSLSSSHIRGLAETPDGTLWVATSTGVNRVVLATQGGQGSFARYASDTTSNSRISGISKNRPLAVDATGRLWAGRGSQIEYYDPRADAFHGVRVKVPETAKSSERHVNHLLWDSEGLLWITYENGNLYRYRAADTQATSFTVVAKYGYKKGDSRSLSGVIPNGLVDDGRGSLWISLWDGGVCRIDLKSGDVEQMIHTPSNPASIPDGYMMLIASDRNGTIWVGSYGKGLLSITKSSEAGSPYAFHLYSHNSDREKSLSDNRIRPIYCDPSGILWVGTESGLNTCLPGPGFIHVQVPPPKEPGTEPSPEASASEPVTAIQEDHAGNLWLGSRSFTETYLGTGLALITAASAGSPSQTVRFQSDPATSGSLTNDQIAVIFEDSRRNLWVGTDGGGLHQVLWDGKDPKTVRFRSCRQEAGAPEKAVDDRKVLAIFEDREHRLWLGTWGGGLMQFLPETRQFLPVDLDPDNATEGLAQQIRSIVQDAEGRLWIGTGYAGIYRYDPSTQQIVHFQARENETSGLWDDRIYCLLSGDPSGAIWIASRNGVGKCNPSNGIFTRYGLEQGLPYRETYGILGDFRPDRKPSLWVTTQGALVRLDPEFGVFQSFEYQHSAQVPEFLEGGYSVSPRGEMMVGGVGGMLRFFPSWFDPPVSTPRVVISDFKLFGESVQVGENDEGRILLTRDVSKSQSLTLSHKNTNLEIVMSVLDYEDPGNNRLRYKLEGVDNDWVETDMQRPSARYMNLKPGTYVFRAQGANCYGVWSTKDAVLILEIIPPFWATWWFLSLTTSSVGTLMIVGYRWRTYRILQRNLELQENNQRLLEQIAERERVEEKLRQSEERYRTLVSNLPAIIFSFDPDTWLTLYISDAVLATTGYAPACFLTGEQTTLLTLVVAEDRPGFQNAVQQALATRRSFSVEYRIQDKEGKRHWFYARGQGVYDPDGKARRVEGAMLDITEKKEVESRLFDSEQNLAITMDSINEGVVAIDQQGRIVRMNPVAEQMTGWEQRSAIGRNFGEVVSLIQTESRLPVNHRLSNHDGHGFESPVPGQAYQIVSQPDGRERRVSWSVATIRTPEGTSVGSVFVFHDETEKYNLEEQLRQAQKMESLGRLAGGIAHDFNNLLGPILGYAEMIQFNSEPGSVLNEQADVIMRAAERAAGLTRQLLSFSRKGKTVSVEVEMHRVLDDVIGMLKRTIDPRVELRTHYGARNARLMGDPSQLQNAILNLAINARDAMPQGGVLAFSTRDVTLDSAYCARQPEPVPPGPYLEVCVTDTGVGMDRETLARIFEPFFTTKELGKGTGLGMASVYSAVKQHQGLIQVQSELGRGTQITLLLPQDTLEGKIEVPTGEFAAGGEGLILVVDDEKAIRNVLDDALQHLGYSTILACDGQEGVELFEQHHPQIAAVILDYMMPKRNGREVLAFMRKTNPSVPVLIASGYSFGADEKTFLSEGAVGYVEKPFRIQTIAEKIQEAIRNRR
jgi:PAS domain S-box-containing protein